MIIRCNPLTALRFAAMGMCQQGGKKAKFLSVDLDGLDDQLYGTPLADFGAGNDWPAGAFTTAWWFKSADGASRYLAGFLGVGFSLRVFSGTGGGPVFRPILGGWGAGDVMDMGELPRSGVDWDLLGLTYDGAGTWKAWINGVDTQTRVYAHPGMAVENIALGAHPAYGGNVACRIARFGVWDVALGAPDFANFVARPRKVDWAAMPSCLLDYWPGNTPGDSTAAGGYVFNRADANTGRSPAMTRLEAQNMAADDLVEDHP